MAQVVKPTHKPVKTYYARRKELDQQGAVSEQSVRDAFGSLLEDTARRQGWTLVNEQRVEGVDRRIYPDGTMRDEFNRPRGHWEAKDAADDLAEAIRDKRDKGYPFKNIIFENTQDAILIQEGQEVYRAEMSDRHQLAALLSQFYSYTESTIEHFDQAVAQFQEEIPPLAKGLKARIAEAHRGNRRFQTAFGEFMALCKEALNPNIRREAVDEMLIQHMLTERLLHNVFDMPGFARRNVIAREVENVIDALTSQHFNRAEFLGRLDYFYSAIEDTARALHDFSEKQRFINTVYERFFQGYSVKVADTHGIVYTPQEIVDFMCAAVEEVLATEFNLHLGDAGVHVLDPCTGTGNFVVNLLRRVPRQHLARTYREQFFANEVMLMPYYIAALNIEHEYHALTGQYEPFDGLCFVDTLDLDTRHLVAGQQLALLDMFTEENTQRVQHEQDANIFVIIGNPPYNVGQLNENDNNKNRQYDVVDRRVSETYAADSAATNKNALSDAYVKFFRWATDRLGERDGIVCFVSNNSFVDQIAFDGMRQHLLQDFTRIYHIDLHGNVRQNPKLSGTTHNVFGIQVGVGITVAVRSAKHARPQLLYHRVPEFWRKEEKLGWLDRMNFASRVIQPPPGVRQQEPPPGLPRARGRRQGAPADETPSLPAGRVGEGSGWRTPPELWAKLKPLARQMRREPTAAENKLWQQLRRKQVLGYKFRRQHTIDRFIVDFYCHEARLVIEVDGPIHDYTQEEDAIRQAFIESQGFYVLRFSNEAVLEETDAVIDRIAEVLMDPHLPLVSDPHLTSPASDPHLASPASGGGIGARAANAFSLPARGEGRGGVMKPLLAVPWRALKPNHRHTWLVPTHADEFEDSIRIADREEKASKNVQAVFWTFGRGVATTRDSVVYDYSQPILIERVQQFIEDYNAEVDRYHRAGGKANIDDFVSYERVKWSRDLKLDLARRNYAAYDASKIRATVYRPYAKRHLFFDRILNEEVYVFPSMFPTTESEQENMVIAITDRGSEKQFMALVTKSITDMHVVGAGSSAQCFPYYVYDEDGSNRRENITDWALAQFRAHYGDDAISKWDIFYYVYGLLHHPGYRARYADNLKRELPRLPFAPDFHAFAQAGRELAEWHLGYEQVEPYQLTWEWADDVPASFRVEKMRLRDPHLASPASGGGIGTHAKSPLRARGGDLGVGYKAYQEGRTAVTF